jgi:hypothetical protein
MPEVSRVPANRVSWRTRVRLFVFVVAVVALAVWLVPKTPEGTWMRWVAWGAIPVVVFGGVRLLRGPRSSTLRRQ